MANTSFELKIGIHGDREAIEQYLRDILKMGSERRLLLAGGGKFTHEEHEWRFTKGFD